MFRLVFLVFAFATFVSCGDESKPHEPSKEECQKACEERRRVEARSWESIVADCEKECAYLN